ncbi:MAG: carboxypeptidase regulatory-like domain-containing protein, partial [Thaumarchaeota archaeon]|nr:carboxypeptidase regulatory-like domain-containing protein [Nitrososphaerota archaeon]
MIVYRNDSVSEYNISLTRGDEEYYEMAGNDYSIELLDNNSNVFWNRSFDIYFDYNGPVQPGVNYSNISYDDFLLTFKIPYDTNMKKIDFYHNGTIIFSKNITFMIGKIFGTVRDINGTPVANALLDLQGPMFGSVHTNVLGEYQFVGATDGSYTVFVTPSPLDNLFGALSYTSVSGGQESDLNFTLQPAGTIAGYILNESGAVVTNVIVYTSGYETPRYAPDSNGFYAVPELTTGIYTVSVDASDTLYSDEYASVNVTVGETTWLNFTLKPGGFGALEGFVTAPNGTPVYGAYITISGLDYRSMYTD